MSLPAVLYVRDLRLMLGGWSAERVRRFMVRNGLARTEVPAEPDGLPRKYTTVAILAERMPDALAAFQIKWAEVENTMDPNDFSDLEDE